jgi:hypothetical protein
VLGTSVSLSRKYPNVAALSVGRRAQRTFPHSIEQAQLISIKVPCLNPLSSSNLQTLTVRSTMASTAEITHQSAAEPSTSTEMEDNSMGFYNLPLPQLKWVYQSAIKLLDALEDRDFTNCDGVDPEKAAAFLKWNENHSLSGMLIRARLFETDALDWLDQALNTWHEPEWEEETVHPLRGKNYIVKIEVGAPMLKVVFIDEDDNGAVKLLWPCDGDYLWRMISHEGEAYMERSCAGDDGGFDMILRVSGAKEE